METYGEDFRALINICTIKKFILYLPHYYHNSMTIKNGFEYLGFRFGFKNKELYRLPTIKNNRHYPLKKVPVISLSDTGKGFRLIRSKKSILQVRAMVTQVNWKIEEECKECL